MAWRARNRSGEERFHHCCDWTAGLHRILRISRVSAVMLLQNRLTSHWPETAALIFHSQVHRLGVKSASRVSLCLVLRLKGLLGQKAGAKRQADHTHCSDPCFLKPSDLPLPEANPGQRQWGEGVDLPWGEPW